MSSGRADALLWDARRGRCRLPLHTWIDPLPPPHIRGVHGLTGASPVTLDGMGIRYFAYAVDAHETDPGRVIPDQDLLDLDKAWSVLQGLTRPEGCIEDARPAFRMFDGHVRMCPGTMCWEGWTRTIGPDDVPPIAVDVRQLQDDYRELYPEDIDDEIAYVRHHLAAAAEFTTRLAFEGRGFTYHIG